MLVGYKLASLSDIKFKKIEIFLISRLFKKSFTRHFVHLNWGFFNFLLIFISDFSFSVQWSRQFYPNRRGSQFLPWVIKHLWNLASRGFQLNFLVEWFQHGLMSFHTWFHERYFWLILRQTPASFPQAQFLEMSRASPFFIL